jgi:hypothetical protein
LAPVEEPVPLKVKDVLLQSSTPTPAETETVGSVVLAKTETFALEVQPVTVLVTSKLYVPAAFTTGISVVEPETRPGPVHRYAKLAPVEEPEPLKVSDVLLQSSTPTPAETDTVGSVVLADTETLALEVQPVTVLVTSKLYVPAAFTTGASVVEPETMPGPVHR